MQTVPRPDSDGFVGREALRAFARRVSLDEFVQTFKTPMLEVVTLAPEAECPGTEGSKIEHSIKRTTVTEHDEDASDDNTTTKRFDLRRVVRNYSDKIAVLAKRPGNPFPQMVSIGRAMNNDVVSMLHSVSKLHGYFLVAGQSWSFTDHRSTNGTLLNGVGIEAGKKFPLSDGDRLRLGLEFNVVFLRPETVYERIRGS